MRGPAPHIVQLNYGGAAIVQLNYWTPLLSPSLSAKAPILVLHPLFIVLCTSVLCSTPPFTLPSRAAESKSRHGRLSLARPALAEGEGGDVLSRMSELFRFGRRGTARGKKTLNELKSVALSASFIPKRPRTEILAKRLLYYVADY